MKITVERTKDSVEVLLIRFKEKLKYSFINLTKNHICSCEFDSILEGIEDLNSYPYVISYKVDEMSLEELKLFIEDLTDSEGTVFSKDEYISFNKNNTCFYIEKVDNSYLFSHNKNNVYFNDITDLIKTFNVEFNLTFYREEFTINNSSII